MTGFESPWQLLAVIAAGVAAGAANAIAGGGTAVSFPFLVLIGLPPVAANASNAVGLVPGAIAASWSYRAELRSAHPLMLWLALPSLAGGVAGAWLLIRLPASWFAGIAPWLVLLAAASVLLEPLVRRRIRAGIDGSRGAVVAGGVAWLAVSLYGGYFGAGIGLLILTTLGLMGVHDLQHANGLKNLLSVAIKVPAVLYFIVIGLPVWPATLALMAGSTAGGWATAHVIQKVDTRKLRWLVAAVGATLGLLMFR